MTEPQSAFPRPSSPGLVLGLLLVLGTNWGLGFSLVKIAANAGVPAIGYACWMNAGAGLVLLAVALARGHVPPLDRTHLAYYLVTGVTALAIPSATMVIVVGRVPVGVMALIVTLSPIFTYGFSMVLRLEGFSARNALGMALGLGGALLIVLPRASLPDPEMGWWVALGIVTPLFYAGSNIYIALRRPEGVHSLALAAAMQLSAGAAVGLAALATGDIYVPSAIPGPAEFAILGHILVASLGSLMFFEVMRLAGPVVLSQVAYVVTLTGIVWGMALFGERHSVWVWAAMGAIFAGLVLVTRPERAFGKSRG